MKKAFTTSETSFLLILCLIISLSGCIFRDLKKEVSEFEKTYGLAGKITLPSAPRGSIVVMLYSQSEGKNEITAYTIAAGTGRFSFLTPEQSN